MSEVENWMTTAVCKVCNAVGTIRRILYGYPTQEMANNLDVVLGGCCVTDNDPQYACTSCHWKYNRSQKTGELIGFPFDLSAEQN